VSRPVVSAYQLPWARGLDFAASVTLVDLIVTSGVTGHHDDGSLDAEPEAQIRQAFRNLDAVLEAAGGSLATIVRLTTYFARAEDYPAFKRVRSEVVPEPYPASTGVVVGLLLPGMLIELEALATRGERRIAEAPEGSEARVGAVGRENLEAPEEPAAPAAG
jgi:2-iminobutanoate/2-iminopropanoate deaminase